MKHGFDEAYYQQGSERGTQYWNYLEGAKINRTYFEIAQTMVELFRPTRTLEIGCATGVIVGHLRTFNVDAHGIDVSEWAVEHRVTDTVQLGSADSLPFDDGYFDLVYSVHALEHLTDDVKEKAFAELSRVCSGFQFHMIPMLESGPYVGDRFGHLLNLRTDPTHNLLFEREWWVDQFRKHSFVDTGLLFSVVHDNAYYELSSCQLLMSRNEPGEDFAARVATHNHKVAEALSLALNGKPGPGLDVHIQRLREQFAQEQPADAPSEDSSSDEPATAQVTEGVSTAGASASAIDEFAAAKIENQKLLIEDLKEQLARIPLLKARVEELQRLAAGKEERLAATKKELQLRQSELASLTKKVLEAEDEAQEQQDTAERLREIVRAFMVERPWWRVMPGAVRRRRLERRLKRLGAFDANAYVAAFPDVAKAGHEPLRHYIFHGIDEIRKGRR